MLVRGDSRKVDWLVVAAVSAVVVVTGVVAFEVVALVRSDTKTVNRPSLLASDGSSVNRSAYEIPGFATGRTGDPPPPSFPLIRLIDPDREPVAGKRSADGTCRPPQLPAKRRPSRALRSLPSRRHPRSCRSRPRRRRSGRTSRSSQS